MFKSEKIDKFLRENKKELNELLPPTFKWVFGNFVKVINKHNNQVVRGWLWYKFMNSDNQIDIKYFKDAVNEIWECKNE